MKEIIAIVNQKGGVAKSTTALSVGAGLKQKGYSVLMIDLDSQGSLSCTMKANEEELSSMEVLSQTASASDAIQKTDVGDIIPASLDLAGADLSINGDGMEYRLRDALKPLAGQYDYIVIDAPPSLGVLTVNALSACNSVIIPTQADTYSLRGINQLYNTVSTVKQYCNPDLSVKGILLTRYSPRAILSREMADVFSEVAEQFGTHLFKATIREAIAVKEAQASQQDIFTYAPKSKVASDYECLVDELLSDESEGAK